MLDVDVNGLASFHCDHTVVGLEFVNWDASFGFESDVDQDVVGADFQNLTFGDLILFHLSLIGLVLGEERFEVCARWKLGCHELLEN